MTPNKVVKAFDGTLVFIDHIVKIEKVDTTTSATLVDGSKVTLSLAGAPPAVTVLGNHVHVAATWTS